MFLFLILSPFLLFHHLYHRFLWFIHEWCVVLLPPAGDELHEQTGRERIRWLQQRHVSTATHTRQEVKRTGALWVNSAHLPTTQVPVGARVRGPELRHRLLPEGEEGELGAPVQTLATFCLRSEQMIPCLVCRRVLSVVLLPPVFS